MYKAALKFLLGVAVVVGIIAGILRAVWVVPVHITDDGMAPTLLAGETVLMWKSDGAPEYGDVVVCQHPQQRGFVVGRYIARSGATVGSSERGGALSINGRCRTSTTRGAEAFTVQGETRPRQVRRGVEVISGEEHQFLQDARNGFRMREVRVRSGMFLLGDNRMNHVHDSRAFGPVDPATCVGSIFMRWETAPGRTSFDHARLDLIH